MTERRWQRSAVGLLGLMIGVSLLISPDRRRPWLAAAPLFLGLVLYAAASFRPSLVARARWVTLALLAACGGLASLAPLGMLSPQHTLFRWVPPLLWLQQRFPISLNTNVVAGALVMLLPVIPAVWLWLAPSRRDSWLTLGLAAASGLLGAAVMYWTHSQAGMLALAAALAVLAALHDLNLAIQYCDRLVLINNGQIHAEGTPTEVITAENIATVYGAESCVYEHPFNGLPCVLLSAGNGRASGARDEIRKDAG